jgi:uncharacterized protein (TIGR03118 family)
MYVSRIRLAFGAAVTATLTLALTVPSGSLSALGQNSNHREAGASTYKQTNLVADTPGKAQITDPNLVNAWGASYGPGTPLWVSDNGTNVSTLYAGGIHGGTQSIVPLVVHIPGGVPTGQVFNPTKRFVVKSANGSSAPALFLFVGESGHLTGWAPNVPGPATSTHAQNAVVMPKAVFKGLALGRSDRGPRLYAANFASGMVDVFNGKFRRVITHGNFVDRRLPRAYAPFNVAVLNSKVYVAYAKQDPMSADELDGPGLGRVDVFTMNGTLLRRLGHHSQLNAPWGLTIAPRHFGTHSGDLLVGNFGNGRIHAYNPRTLAPRGVLRNGAHTPITIDGLWAILPGNGTEAAKDELLFTAGPDDEAHGLLGTLSAGAK